MTTLDLMTAFSEIALALGAMVLLMLGAFGKRAADDALILYTAVGLLAFLGVTEASSNGGGQTAFNGLFVADAFANYAKAVILLGSAASLMLARDYLVRNKMMQYEYPVLILLATLGMLVMVSAGDLMTLYMGVELQSLALYVVAAFRRDSPRSTEAGLKYFVLGAISSGLLLYGASLIYGYTGTTRLVGIAEVVRADGVSMGLTFGLVFLCAGLAFKISAAPFHMWTPDVYEGSPTPVTAFFATAPKVAAGALFARALFDGFGDAVETWRQILVFVSIASMFLGAVAAIGQTNIKRLLAYSSIGHMGFALVGLSAGTLEGAQALLIYLAIYVVMNVGVFAFIIGMEKGGRPAIRIADLAGLSSTHPNMAACLAALFLSLAGIPPLVGFFGKYYVFVAAVEAGLVWLAVAGAIASVIGAFYYLRLVKVMYFDPASEPLDMRMPFTHRLALGSAAVVMSFAWLPFINGFGLVEAAADAAASLLG